MKTLEETKAAHAEQVRDILKELRPDLTPGQVRKIQQEAAAVIGDWDIAPLNRASTEVIVEGLVGTRPELTRKIPKKETVQAYREEQYKTLHQVDRVPVEVRMLYGRELASASDDTLLELCPFEGVKDIEARPMTQVEKLSARTTQSDDENDAAWIKATFGVEAATLLPSKKRALLAERDKNANPQALRRDALTLDNLAGKDPAKLTPIERLTQHRAQEALKKRA